MNRAFIPTLFNTLLDEDTFSSFFNKGRSNSWQGDSSSAGVNLYEDDQAFYLEAHVPGAKPEEIKLLFNQGGLSIEVQPLEEKKEVKYYIKSASSRSYWIPLPAGKIDEGATPEASCKDGILKVVFAKSKASRPVKIAVKSA